MRKTNRKLFTIAGLALLAQTPGVGWADSKVRSETQVQRLAALGRVWGVVKFFHPYLAYRRIDWDGALIKAIPRVRGASTAAEFRAAVESMLSVLGDPATTASVATLAAAADSGSGPEVNDDPVKVMDGMVVVRVSILDLLMASDRTRGLETRQRLTTELDKARSVTLDCRADRAIDAYRSFTFSRTLGSLMEEVLSEPVTLAAHRFRLHSGYPPAGGQTSGGYFSTLSTEAPARIPGRRKKGPKLNIAIITNRYTPSNPELLGGIQAAGAAVIVQHGSHVAPARGAAFEMDLGEGVRASIRTSEIINPDGTSEVKPDVTVPDVASSGKEDPGLAAALREWKRPVRRSRASPASPAVMALPLADEPYADMKAPDREHRLLALFRCWNVINYFFPYKSLLDEPWDKTLSRFIPRFDSAGDSMDYQRAIHELSAAIQDTHAFTTGTTVLQHDFGTHAPPLAAEHVEGRTVVVSSPGVAGVDPGDVILEVDGEQPAARLARIARLLSSSTPQAGMAAAHRLLFLGPQGSTLKVLVENASGEKKTVEIPRTLTVREHYQSVVPRRASPVYQVLPNGYGYIDLGRLPQADSDKAMDALQHTPAIIFDMRGYPNGTAWTISPRLTAKRNVPAAQFRRPLISARALSDSDLDAEYFGFTQPLPPPREPAYKGRVVMLINESAISQAEHTCLFFQSAADVTFIGTPTAGANGDVTNLVLPGNFFVNFSGHDVRHADGRQLQRVGIQPQVRAAPTARGIREKRDEVLEAAFAFLDGKLKTAGK